MTAALFGSRIVAIIVVTAASRPILAMLQLLMLLLRRRLQLLHFGNTHTHTIHKQQQQDILRLPSIDVAQIVVKLLLLYSSFLFSKLFNIELKNTQKIIKKHTRRTRADREKQDEQQRATRLWRRRRLMGPEKQAAAVAATAAAAVATATAAAAAANKTTRRLRKQSALRSSQQRLRSQRACADAAARPITRFCYFSVVVFVAAAATDTVQCQPNQREQRERES